jgi:hypothetical protein
MLGENVVSVRVYKMRGSIGVVPQGYFSGERKWGKVSFFDRQGVEDLYNLLAFVSLSSSSIFIKINEEGDQNKVTLYGYADGEKKETEPVYFNREGVDGLMEILRFANEYNSRLFSIETVY